MVQRSVSTSDLGSSVLEVGPSCHNAVLSGVNWDLDHDVFTSDFVDKYPLPHLALVTKGQYMQIGVPNVSKPSLRPYVLIHSKQTVRKVLAEVVRPRDARKGFLQPEQKIAIPEGYEGFFEILSEEGRSTRSIELVKDLFKLFPELVLVRAPCKAYFPDDEVRLIKSMHKTRQIEPGEVLTLVGQFNFKKTAYLRCFDELGKSVYLKMSQKSKFSPVAHKDAISGVHYIKNLMQSKRFPLTVRLIQGALPQDLKLYSSNPFPVLKLKAVFEEDAILAYVLHRNGEIISIPLNSYLRVAPSLNHSHISTRPEFRAIIDHCDRQSGDHASRISSFNDQLVNLRTIEIEPLQRIQEEKNSKESAQIGTEATSADNNSSVPDEEIDQLYDYIRGFAPLPTSLQKPPPPPLETLPSRVSDESEKVRSGGRGKSKERRHGGYIKNDNVPLPNFENGRHRHHDKRMYNLSKSTEKLAHASCTNLTNGGDHEKDGPRRASHSYEKKYLRQASGPGARGGKLRPISMVLPEKAAIYPHGHGPEDFPLKNSKLSGSSHRFPSASNLYNLDPVLMKSERHLPVMGGPPPPYTAYKGPLYHRYPMHPRF